MFKVKSSVVRSMNMYSSLRKRLPSSWKVELSWYLKVKSATHSSVHDRISMPLYRHDSVKGHS